jgi:hypothetical protein
LAATTSGAGNIAGVIQRSVAAGDEGWTQTPLHVTLHTVYAQQCPHVRALRSTTQSGHANVTSALQRDAHHVSCLTCTLRLLHFSRRPAQLARRPRMQLATALPARIRHSPQQAQGAARQYAWDLLQQNEYSILCDVLPQQQERHLIQSGTATTKIVKNHEAELRHIRDWPRWTTSSPLATSLLTSDRLVEIAQRTGVQGRKREVGAALFLDEARVSAILPLTGSSRRIVLARFWCREWLRYTSVRVCRTGWHCIEPRTCSCNVSNPNDRRGSSG